MTVPYTLSKTKDSMSALGGLLTLIELMDQLELPDESIRLLPKPGNESGFTQWEFLRTFMLKQHAGLFRMSHVSKLQDNEGLLKVLGVEKLPQGQTLSRWLRESSKNEEIFTGLKKINQGLIEAGLELRNISKVTLDIDATVISSGKSGAKLCYHGFPSFSVMLGHIAETGQVAHVEFRDGNVPASKDNLRFIQECERELPDWAELGCVRSDAAGYQEDIFRDLIDRNIDVMVRARKCPQLMQCADELPEKSWKPRKGPGGGKIRGEWVGRCVHTIGDYEKPFTVVVQRSPRFDRRGEERDEPLDDNAYKKGDYVTRFIATTMDEKSDSANVRCYNQRAECSENRVKEYKLDFGGGVLPCSNFKANALYCLLVAIAYNLYVLLRMLLPKRLRRRRVTTCRLLLYQTAAKVVRHANRLYVKVSPRDYNLLSRALSLMRTINAPPFPA